jgi:hypothetical protein
MRKLMVKILVLVVMIGFLISANTSQSAPLNCNWICWRGCNDQFNECLNNFDYFTCCGEFNSCITTCGTSCVRCEQ